MHTNYQKALCLMNEPKHVLVTGASRGIGRAICQRLHADGYAITGLARTRPADWPDHMPFHCVDLAERTTVNDLLKELTAKTHFYGLVNNVGFVPTGLIDDVTSDDLYKAIALNVEINILCAQAVLPSMRANQKGRIVNIGSRAGLGKRGRTLYSLAKAGIIGMTRTWALELAAQGITVNTIAPGPIATEFFTGANNENDQATRQLLAGIPVGRIGQPADVAHAVAYFMDERCGFVTGQTHYVCGGITIGAA
jgi:NAD(P)-dependent dehydrogenase (short-subunit alcohol dehydrogenase family)